MYRQVANSIAAVHAVWLLLTMLGPGIAWWVSPLLLAIAAAANLVVYLDKRYQINEDSSIMERSTCPLFLLEHYYWRKGKCGKYPISMSRRMFRWIGIHLSEEQTGRLVVFISALLAIVSLMQRVQA